MQRGIAILLIFFINIPAMGNTIYYYFGDARLLGWSAADHATWWFLAVFVEGTQRGLLELLFGAGAVILLERTMVRDGPVEVADLYFRRNLWLVAFGLLDTFGLMWFGDILLPYGLVAIFLFPFRRLGAKALLALCLLGVGETVVQGALAYRHDARVYAAAVEVQAKQAHGQTLGPDDRQALAAREEQLGPPHFPAQVFAEERAARFGSAVGLARWLIHIWTGPVLQGTASRLLELFFSMFLGMALFKFGVIQGRQSARFYAFLASAAYAFGLSERVLGAWQLAQFRNLPNVETVGGAAARLAVTVGHVAFINLLMTSGTGQRVLAPFRAAGRSAFSLYLLQNFVGLWVLFPGVGFGLWGRYGWFDLTMIALAAVAVQLVLANVWLRYFAMGPLEWLWRSLSYQRLQPMRHRIAKPDPVVV